MGNKKDEELPCLEIVQKRCHPVGNYAKSIYRKLSKMTSESEQERPDMLFGSVGLEHFLVDIIHKNGKKAKSLSRLPSKQHMDKIQKYMSQPDLLSDRKNLESEKEWLEDVINSMMNGISDFTYDRFLDNFKRVYDSHLKNAKAYLTQ